MSRRAYKCLQSAFLSLLLSVVTYSQVFATEQSITFAANPSSAKQQEVYHLLAKRFEELNPDISVDVSSQSLEAHKVRIHNFNQGTEQEIDVLLAYAGTQLHDLIASGRVAPLTPLWQEHQFDRRFSVTVRELVSVDHTAYAIPMAYYQWGFYYRKSLFSRLGLSPPDNWSEFLRIIDILSENQITPLNFSGGSAWSALAWFDYLSLRLLGREHYLALVKGDASFSTPEVEEVFIYWQQIIQAGAFEPDHAPMTWAEILPFFYRGRMAMMLNGNFFLAHVPERIRQDIGFFAFPQLKPDIPRFESAPTDVAVLAAHAANKPAAKKFITFLASLEAQRLVANYVGKISPHYRYQPESRYLLDEGKQHLLSADGLVQYFDREASAKFSAAAADLFVRFMHQQITIDRLTATLDELDHAAESQ